MNISSLWIYKYEVHDPCVVHLTDNPWEKHIAFSLTTREEKERGLGNEVDYVIGMECSGSNLRGLQKRGRVVGQEDK